jgi:hypothetical protein
VVSAVASMTDLASLARFRADPRRVRVAVRRFGSCYLAMVRDRSCAYARSYEAAHVSAERAVILALEHAARSALSGVDLGMQWAYEHPWGSTGRAARGDEP